MVIPCSRQALSSRDLAPVLLGAGVRLFDQLDEAAEADFEIDRVVESPDVTHLRYRVRR